MRLGTIDVSSRGALPTYIKEGGSLGHAQVGGILLGPLVQFAPYHIWTRGKGRRGGEGSRSPTSYFPFPPLLSLSLHVGGPIGGAPAPCGLVCSLTWPIKPMSLPGVARNPFRWPGITWNTSGVQIPSSYIWIFTSQLFRDSSSCPWSHPGLRTNFSHQKHITQNRYRHRTLSVRTLWVQELCRHDRDISPVNNQ